jgi:hypothetical protein
MATVACAALVEVPRACWRSIATFEVTTAGQALKGTTSRHSRASRLQVQVIHLASACATREALCPSLRARPNPEKIDIDACLY